MIHYPFLTSMNLYLWDLVPTYHTHSATTHIPVLPMKFLVLILIIILNMYAAYFPYLVFGDYIWVVSAHI